MNHDAINFSEEIYNLLFNESEITEDEKVAILDFMKECNDHYYNTSQTLIPDESYDKIKRILRDKFNIDTHVGSVPKEEELKRSRLTTKDHHFTELVGSLRDVTEINEVKSFFDKITTDFLPGDLLYICASIKVDGNSVTLTFNPDGSLLDAITRGEDNMGVDLTHMFKHVSINTQPIRTIFSEGLLSIKCEAVITHELLPHVNEKRVSETGKKPYANGRSAITGILGNDNAIEYAQFIRLVPIDIRITNVEPEREFSIIYMNQITDNNPVFLKFPFETTRATREDAYAFIESYKLARQNDRVYAPYMVDGVVIEILNPNARKNAGWTGVYPNHSIAYKFDFFTAVTTLTAMEYDFGYKTGRITPVVRFEDVIHNGATFNRVSLSSYLRFSKLKAHYGQLATFQYRMDTLGYIEPLYVSDNTPDINEEYLEHAHEFHFIEDCPICNSKLHIPEDPEVEAFVHCINPDCKGNVMSFFIRFLDVKRAKGIAEKTIEKFVEAGILKHPSDLFKLTREQILSVDGFLDKSADIILTEVDSIKATLVDWQLIAGLPIESVGEDRASAVTREIPLESLINAIDEMGTTEVVAGLVEMNIPNVGEKSATAIVEAVSQYRDQLLEILSLCTVKETSKLALRFAITGSVKFEGKRNGLIKFLNGLGHKVADISKDTNYLVCNSISNSDKCNMAQKYGIPIISEDQLLEMLK